MSLDDKRIPRESKLEMSPYEGTDQNQLIQIHTTSDLDSDSNDSDAAKDSGETQRNSALP